jgi:hypothetical protein
MLSPIHQLAVEDRFFGPSQRPDVIVTITWLPPAQNDLRPNVVVEGTIAFRETEQSSVSLVGILRKTEPLVPEIGSAARAPGHLPHPPQAGDHQRHQQSNHGDHHQQFDQCERPPASPRPMSKVPHCLPPAHAFSLHNLSSILRFLSGGHQARRRRNLSRVAANVRKRRVFDVSNR